MIGLFDSGHGGLTILASLARRFPDVPFLYLGDHAHAPYGNRESDEIIALTRQGVEWLFASGARLVILACNTATAVAARTLQRDWLPQAGWPGCNVLGIIAPTVEAATQTPWAVTTPQYPQKYMTDSVLVFATARTVATEVFPEEIRKRCPRVRVVQQACPGLAGAIEAATPKADLDALVAGYAREAMSRLAPSLPDRAILGCTHFPLVEDLFRRHLPERTRLLAQQHLVADSLEDYLARHPGYCQANLRGGSEHMRIRHFTTGDPVVVDRSLAVFSSARIRFACANLPQRLRPAGRRAAG